MTAPRIRRIGNREDNEPTPNLPLLRKVLDHIEAHPEEWRQQSWCSLTDEGRAQVERAWWELEDKAAPCGTRFCVAGHAVNMTVGVRRWGGAHIVPNDDDTCWASVAQRELGLTDREREGLFHGDNDWSEIKRIAARIAKRAGEVL